MCVVYHVDTTMDRKHFDRMKNRRHLNNRWKRAATCFCKLAIDRLSHAAYRSLPTPIRIPEHSSRRSGQRRLLFTQPQVTPKHEQHRGTSLRNLYFPITVSHRSALSLAVVPLWFWGTEAFWGSVRCINFDLMPLITPAKTAALTHTSQFILP